MFSFGLLTAILDGWTFEQAVDIAADMGFACLEVACWPAGKAERRYAGVSHIDAEHVLTDDAYAEHVKAYPQSKGIHISSLAYYPNPLDPNTEKSAAAIAHLKALILASEKLGVNMVTTFIGRDQYKTVEENIELFQKVWPPILQLAEEHGVRIAIENCPMLFGPDQWPGGQNLMCTPAIFRKLFALCPSPNFGLNFDPSHYGYTGDAVIEVEDKAFEGSKADVLTSIRLSKRYLDNFVV
ncbi:MAG: sugar phosphate isomerase/epimerase [Clostridia bacterium]|nr:sugar phosphate isomerase/epimerase [Clostridia bacterium]